VLRDYARLSLEAPEELTSISMVMKAPPLEFIPEDKVGSLVLSIFACYKGDVAGGEAALAPFRALAEPVADLVGPMPYSGLYALGEAAEVRARVRVRSGFYEALDDDLVNTIIAFCQSSPEGMNAMQVRPIGNGAFGRVPKEATAFAHRDANFLLAILDHWWEPDEDGVNENWVDAFWAAISAKRRGVYSNFLQAEGEARIKEAYPSDTFERLAKLKLRYDPTNLFRGNENIPPKPLSAVA